MWNGRNGTDRAFSRSIQHFLFTIVLAGVLPAAAGFGAAQSAVQGFRLEGVVKDQSGAVIVGALVTVRTAHTEVSERTTMSGRFVFDSIPLATAELTVEADGFSPVNRRWSNQEAQPIEITLSPAQLAQQVTVTATRTETPLSETAATVRVLPLQQLTATAALTLDDALRQVPGFTLFRRTSSRSANPTSQGVTLRGVGASGASRALVLADGIPLNDPFGGWVYWDRLPRVSVSQVEVVRGGTSDLYGSSAMGGVINFVTRKPTTTALSFEASYGNESTPNASLWASIERGPWSAALDGEGFSTDGYVLVEPVERGRVDVPAGSRHEVADLTLGRKLGEHGDFFVKPTYFRETRTNGTPLTYNRTHLRQIALGADWVSSTLGAFSFRGYGGPEIFDQTFSSVAADRNSESLVRLQRVPAQQTGVDIQWTRPVGARQNLVAGFDGVEVRGASNEIGFSGGRMTSALGARGRQRTLGAFGEDIIHLTSRWQITAAGRFDHWDNYNALVTTRPLSTVGPSRVTNFPERTEAAFSPRLATLYRLTNHVSLLGSAYKAFRAPSLNELYRGFRVGNVQTNANSELTAERLTGAEAGAEFDALDRKFTGRGVFFWSDVSDPIANVTLSVTPSLITRQRQNLGRTRSRGLDLDATWHLTHTLDLIGGYEFVDATVLSFSASPALVGLQIPQVPRHEFTFQALYSNPSAGSRWARTMFGLQGRFVSNQFDDDLNQLPLGSFFVMDATVSHPITHGTEVFFATENLFNQSYAVAATPVLDLGTPRLFRVGFRWNLSRR